DSAKGLSSELENQGYVPACNQRDFLVYFLNASAEPRIPQDGLWGAQYDGFYQPESDETNSWRWSKQYSSLRLERRYIASGLAPELPRVRLSFTVQSFRPGILWMKINDGPEEIVLSKSEISRSVTIDTKVGSSIFFRSENRAELPGTNDTRRLAFRV